MAYDLAIVLPTFNERGNVGPLVERLEKALGGIHYEVIFVDDDSPDGTADAVRRLGERHDNCACCSGLDGGVWPRRVSRGFWLRPRPLWP